MDSQWVDLLIGQIWNSHLEQDLSLTFRLILPFLLHAQEGIETKRGEMILLRALSQLGQLGAWTSFQPCLPFGHTAPSVYPPRDRALPPPPSLPPVYLILTLCSLSLQMFDLMFVSPHWRMFFAIDFFQRVRVGRGERNGKRRCKRKTSLTCLPP